MLASRCWRVACRESARTLSEAAAAREDELEGKIAGLKTDRDEARQQALDLDDELTAARAAHDQAAAALAALQGKHASAQEQLFSTRAAHESIQVCLAAGVESMDDGSALLCSSASRHVVACSMPRHAPVRPSQCNSRMSQAEC
jgi:septal ring factor EnvC (AmiA/AmiB activator)